MSGRFSWALGWLWVGIKVEVGFDDEVGFDHEVAFDDGVTFNISFERSEFHFFPIFGPSFSGFPK